MPEMDGFSTCHKLNEYYPDIKVLILTHLNEQETIRKVLDLNIQGYFTKNTEPQELKNAILKLSNNGFYFEKNLASVIEILIDNPDLASITKSYKPFSKREMQVMKLTLKELNGLEIAEKLCISPKTVEQHKRNLMDKTESKNFIGVIRYALINKLITLKEI
jgi:DNA-binding NarL/FixJ family response regulator